MRLEVLFTRAWKTIDRFDFDVELPLDFRARMEEAYLGFSAAVRGDRFLVDGEIVMQRVDDGRA